MREYVWSLKFVLLIVVVDFIVTSVLYCAASSFRGDTAPEGSVATVNG